MIIPVYKPVGKTPLQTIALLRNNGALGAREVASYAGRLDPLAEGLMLVLAGHDVARQKEFEHLDKAYTVEAIFGIDTDTHDLLGMPALADIGQLTESALLSALAVFKGDYTTQVPHYSAVKVDGKALYAHARDNHAVTPPERTIIIHNISDVFVGACRGEIIQAEAIDKIERVQGDFRQQESIAAWNHLPLDGLIFAAVSFDIACSSGTYVRSIIRDLGEALDTKAVVRSLVRTRVGQYTVENCLII